MIHERAPLRRTVYAGLCSCLALLGCEQEAQVEFYGSLYFEAGPYLGELRLTTGDAMPVTNLGDRRIQRVSDFDRGELLLSVEARRAGQLRQRLLRFNPETLRATSLISGQAGQYLPGSATLVYYAGNELISAPRKRVRHGDAVQTFHWRAPPLLVPIGDFGLLYGPKDGPIYRFDPSQSSTEQLDALSQQCQLLNAVWMTDREELICPARNELTNAETLLVVDLDGRQRDTIVLPEGRTFRPVAYLADQRVLVLNETRSVLLSRDFEYPVWAYLMASGRLQRIAQNQHLGESVVYRRHVR